MERKVVFLDVDGTLCNEQGLVPASASKAIQTARKNGHKVYLCTGRSKAEIYQDIWEIGFDGIIGAGGGYIESDGEILQHKQFQQEDLDDILGYFNANKMEFYIECNHGLFANEGCFAHLLRISEEFLAKGEDPSGCDQFRNALTPLRDEELKEVNKICFLDSGHPFEEVKKRYEQKFTIMHCTVPMFGHNSGEVILKGIDKAQAMESLLYSIHREQKDTIAIGDGMNDAPMLQYAQIGIAMGNADERLKALADDVVASHDDGGILEAFTKYGLL